MASLTKDVEHERGKSPRKQEMRTLQLDLNEPANCASQNPFVTRHVHSDKKGRGTRSHKQQHTDALFLDGTRDLSKTALDLSCLHETSKKSHSRASLKPSTCRQHLSSTPSSTLVTRACLNRKRCVVMNVTDKKTQRWKNAINHSSMQKTTSDPKTSPNQRQMCRPTICTCTEHHVCSVTRQNAHKEELFKDLNFSLYDSKEPVNNPTI